MGERPRDEATLLTRSGDFVTRVVVPLFHPPAEVIIWGSRTFVHNQDMVYREGLAWHADVDPRNRAPRPHAA